jgi:hypothetical protein
MNIRKKIGIVVLSGFVGLVGVELGSQLSVPGISGVVSTAEARVGRPLTPVSVAGVARRTGRRCATGVYNC